MKANQLACLFLCLLVILGLQGCGQKKDANSSEKISGAAATNNSASGSSGKTGNTYRITDRKTGTTLTVHFDSPPSESEIEKKFSEHYLNLKTFNETKARAEQGDAEAQSDLCWRYKNGFGVATNEVEGEKWCRKAAESYRKAAEQAAAYEEEQAKLKAEGISRQATKQTTQESENLKIISKILSDYHKAHTYVGKDIFVCGDMACDVWDIVLTKGIEAKIRVGNVDKDNSSLQQANHAWVMAEVTPGKWLALETTGGYVVGHNQNARYYYGHTFSNPKELRTWEELVRQFQTAERKWRDAMRNCDQIASQYYQAPQNASSSLIKEWNESMVIVDQRIADMVEIAKKINALL